MKSTYLITYKINGVHCSTVSPDPNRAEILKLYKFVTDVKIKRIEYKEISNV